MASQRAAPPGLSTDKKIPPEYLKHKPETHVFHIFKITLPSFSLNHQGKFTMKTLFKEGICFTI